MMFKTKTWIFGACVLALGALADGQQAPVAAAGPFDGTYNGTVKLVRSTITRQGKSDCGSLTTEGRPSSRRVADNKIIVPYGSGEVTFDVGADGTVSGTSAFGSSQLSATGKVTGRALAMEYGSQYCLYRFDGTR